MPFRFSVCFIFAAAALAFSGCRTLQAPAQPNDLWEPPQKYVKGQKIETVSSLKPAKLPETSKPLELLELIDIALDNNPVTRQYWQQARAAKAKAVQARSEWYPEVTFEQDFSENRLVSNRPLQGINQGDIGMSMKMTYMLLDLGGRNARVEQAFQTLLASNYQFNRAIQDLLLSVATAYFDFYSATALKAAAEMDVKDSKATLDATQEKFNAGVQAKLDVLEANSTYQNMLYKSEDASGKIKTAEGQLAKALGFPAGTPLNIALPKKDAGFKVEEKTVSQLIEEGLAKRPDIAAGRANLAAKAAAIKAAKSDLWPTLNAEASGSNDWYRYFGRHGLTYDNQHDYGYAAGVNVKWPVFEGFATVSKIKAAEAEAKSEFEKLRKTEIDATADVWDKYYSFVTAMRKLEFSKAYEESSQGSYDLAMESYKSGLKDIIDLLHAEASLSDARSQLIASRRELYVAFAQLAHSTGTINERTDAAQADAGPVDL